MQLKTFGACTATLGSIGAGALTQSPQYSYLALPVAIGSGVIWLAVLAIYLTKNWRNLRSAILSIIDRARNFVRANLIPLMLGAMGVAGVILIGAAIIGAFTYYSAPSGTTASDPAKEHTITAGIGPPPKPNSDVIQWNTVFGTTAAVDLIFALSLDGRGADTRSIKLKDAFLESAITGERIQMKVAPSPNPLEDTFPISEANPIPPEAFIRLVAQMNPADPNKGVSNKEFLDRWGKIWFNAIYEEGKPDRILFDMSGRFPGLVGPRATRRSDVKNH